MAKILTRNRCIQNVYNSLSENYFFYKQVAFARVIQSRCNTTQESEVYPGMEMFRKLDKISVSTINEILEYISTEMKDHPEQLKKKLSKCMRYTIPCDNLSIVDTYKTLESPDKLTDANLKMANAVAWSAAMTTGAYLIEEDIMEGVSVRNGFPSWHTLENISFAAVNNSVLINSLAYLTLKKYCLDHQYYREINKELHNVNYKRNIGKALDLHSTVNKKPQFELFTKERLNDLISHKTAYYTCRFPVTVALYLSKKFEPNLHDQAVDIAMKIGYLLHVKNDIEDVFGETKVDHFSNIRKGKCTWLAVETLNRGTVDQKHVFKNNYGKHSLESQQIIVDLYKDLQLVQIYKNTEKEALEVINEKVERLSKYFPREVFYIMMRPVTEC